MIESFNTQPPEGGCGYNPRKTRAPPAVSTHSRPKAAAIFFAALFIPIIVSTHSRPKAAAFGFCSNNSGISGFNTQPPEGGCFREIRKRKQVECFNTQPPEGGCSTVLPDYSGAEVFQHTAARRRLRRDRFAGICWYYSFNTQPPEGGC